MTHGSASMEARFIEIGKLQPWEKECWQALAQNAKEPNPFFEPGFLLTASRHFEGFAKTRLLVVQQDNSFKGLIPIVGVERPRLPPRRTGTSRGTPTMVSAFTTPLVDRACTDEASGALLDGLCSAARRHEIPGIVSLERIGGDGPVIESLRRQCAARGMPVFTKESYERGVVTRSGKWQNPLSGSRRREIGRRRRLLARDFGSDVQLVDRTHDPRAAADFLRIEASGWKGQGEGLAMARDKEKVEWFDEWCAFWNEAGRLTVLALNLGDTSVAMQYFVRAGEGIFVFRVAHDAGYPKYGLGQMLFESALELLYETTDALWVDACTDPDNVFFPAMLPERRTTSLLLIGVGGRLDRMVTSAMPAMTKGAAELHRVRMRLARPHAVDSGSSNAG